MNWPDDLYLTAAIRPLATALYVSHCRADRVTPKPFRILLTHQKRVYEEAAIAALKGLRAQPTTLSPASTDWFRLAIDLTKRDGARVLARITPSEPWGAPIEPDARD
jgi:hypothetical protein